MGDLILSLPVAETLKKAFHGCQVYYLAAPGPAALASLIDYVDGWIVDADHQRRPLSLADLASRMRQGNFDHLIELRPSWRTAAAGFLSGIAYRIGTSRRFYSFFYNQRLNLHRKSSGYHQTDLELVMLRALGIQVSGLMPHLKITDSCRARASSLLNLDGKSYIVIHPGSGGSAVDWPLEFYRALAGMLVDDSGLTVVITGNDDRLGAFDGCIDINGKTDLEALAGVVAGARLFISNSTGPLHLADALGTRCVSFYVDRPDVGPVRWGPRHNMENVMTPPGNRCECGNLAHCHCLEQITPDKAFKKVTEILKVGEDRAVIEP